MSIVLLIIGSAVAVGALVAVLAGFLWAIGTHVIHIADTLEQKVAAGGAEIGQHVAAIGPAAAGVRSGVSTLAQLGKDLL